MRQGLGRNNAPRRQLVLGDKSLDDVNVEL